MDLIKQIWEIYDVDGNGSLEGEELKRFLKDVCDADPSLNGKESELLKLIDANGDGELKMEELLEIFNLA